MNSSKLSEDSSVYLPAMGAIVVRVWWRGRDGGNAGQLAGRVGTTSYDYPSLYSSDHLFLLTSPATSIPHPPLVSPPSSSQPHIPTYNLCRTSFPCLLSPTSQLSLLHVIILPLSTPPSSLSPNPTPHLFPININTLFTTSHSTIHKLITYSV